MAPIPFSDFSFIDASIRQCRCYQVNLLYLYTCNIFCYVTVYAEFKSGSSVKCHSAAHQAWIMNSLVSLKREVKGLLLSASLLLNICKAFCKFYVMCFIRADVWPSVTCHEEVRGLKMKVAREAFLEERRKLYLHLMFFILVHHWGLTNVIIAFSSW